MGVGWWSMGEQLKVTQEEQVERALEFRKSKHFPHFPPHASSALINRAVCQSGVFNGELVPGYWYWNSKAKCQRILFIGTLSALANAGEGNWRYYFQVDCATEIQQKMSPAHGSEFSSLALALYFTFFQLNSILEVVRKSRKMEAWTGMVNFSCLQRRDWMVSYTFRAPRG